VSHEDLPNSIDVVAALTANRDGRVALSNTCSYSKRDVVIVGRVGDVLADAHAAAALQAHDSPGGGLSKSGHIR
jgi:hypothetical protein